MKTYYVDRYKHNKPPTTSMGRDLADIKEYQERNKDYVHDSEAYWYENYESLRKYGNEYGSTSSQASKDIRKLIKEAMAIKNQLINNKNTNDHDDTKLLENICRVGSIATHYYNETRDMPYDWIAREFLHEEKRGTRIKYPDLEAVPFDPTSEYVYAESDEDDESENVNDPNCSTLDGFDWATPKQLLELGIGKLLQIIPDMSFPDETEKKIWEEFKELDKATPELEEINHVSVVKELRSIEVDQPIVSVIGNFAVDTFNNACMMHIKKGEHNNIHDFEFMKCEYLKLGIGYYFYLAIEAVEEGNAGIYEAQVIYNSVDDARTLCKFVLTNCIPLGTKAMTLKYLDCLRSICKAVDDLYDEKLTRLTTLSKAIEDDDQYIVDDEINHLKKHHVRARKVLHRRLYLDTQSADFERTTNPDRWSDPGDCCDSRMVRRTVGTTCGYDYYNLHID